MCTERLWFTTSVQVLEFNLRDCYLRLQFAIVIARVAHKHF